MERKRSVRRRQKPPFAERAKDHCRKCTAFLFSNVGIILLVVLYTIAGELVFILLQLIRRGIPQGSKFGPCYLMFC
jgi:hypothetical protein